MRMRIALIVASTALVIAAGCENVNAPTSTLRTGGASFDGAGGTLGSGYGTLPEDSTNTTASDSTGRSGGTLGSGY